MSATYVRLVPDRGSMPPTLDVPTALAKIESALADTAWALRVDSHASLRPHNHLNLRMASLRLSACVSYVRQAGGEEAARVDLCGTLEQLARRLWTLSALLPEGERERLAAEARGRMTRAVREMAGIWGGCEP